MAGSQKCCKDLANTRLDFRNSLQIEGKGMLPGDPSHWGVGTLDTGPYIYTYIYILYTVFFVVCVVPSRSGSMKSDNYTKDQYIRISADQTPITLGARQPSPRSVHCAKTLRSPNPHRAVGKAGCPRWSTEPRSWRTLGKHWGCLQEKISFQWGNDQVLHSLGFLRCPIFWSNKNGTSPAKFSDI